MAGARAHNRWTVRLRGALWASAGVLALGGCANLPKGPFAAPSADVTSPLAADIDRLDLRTAVYPTFLSIPNKPNDVRPVSAWTRNIYDTLRLRRQMAAQEALYPQTLYGAEAFAEGERLRAATPLTPAEIAALSDRTAAFAKTGRERATPPSPAHP
jgi:hypothetical protein